MFAPSQDDVRRFFCRVYQRQRAGEPLAPMEAMAADWIAEHPEYHADLADEAAALATTFAVEDGRTNPFLHLAMHLSLSEQVGVDQPAGVRAAFVALREQLGSAHAAQHRMMECLGEMLWTSQRSGLPLDGAAYVDCLRRRTGRSA